MFFTLRKFLKESCPLLYKGIGFKKINHAVITSELGARELIIGTKTINMSIIYEEDFIIEWDNTSNAKYETTLPDSLENIIDTSNIISNYQTKFNTFCADIRTFANSSSDNKVLIQEESNKLFDFIYKGVMGIHKVDPYHYISLSGDELKIKHSITELYKREYQNSLNYIIPKLFGKKKESDFNSGAKRKKKKKPEEALVKMSFKSVIMGYIKTSEEYKWVEEVFDNHNKELKDLKLIDRHTRKDSLINAFRNVEVSTQIEWTGSENQCKLLFKELKTKNFIPQDSKQKEIYNVFSFENANEHSPYKTSHINDSLKSLIKTQFPVTSTDLEELAKFNSE